MIFNPITKKLYTDDNKFIKRMYCPYSALQWSDLSAIEGSMDRHCVICESVVVDTAAMDDKSVWQLLQKKPETCLKIDRNQDNIRIDHHV